MWNMTIQKIANMSEDSYIYVDVRSKIAYQHGHIANAVHWNGSDNIIFPKNKKIIVYCTYGKNSIPLVEKLKKRGYDVYNLSGGYREWLIHNSEELSNEEINRYNRQIILEQIGIEGQLKLKNASVLIIGAGGLGSPVALYLAGAGVGTIGIMDADNVSISNLQRQIIHNTENIGLNKAESAKLALRKLNDKITVKAYPYFLTAENAERIISEYDFIIDATDNFETKFLINDACVLLKKPFCHAGIMHFEGQVMTYVPEEYPCYRCIFEEIPESETIPNCSQAGIIGAVAGIVGSIQALEAIKYILGMGELLTGKIFIIDGLSMKTRIAEFTVKNKKCKVCGENPLIKNIQDNAEEYTVNVCKLQ
ncbi:MAG: molybdopterin-synthase adenylyltransferase MoeB [Ruminococcus sp.]|nr:molybdopterin-synthase adenylyltransferase MoeB [Ruminococcus sp.]